LLDKFRDVLITCETEDPAIAMFYSHSYTWDSLQTPRSFTRFVGWEWELLGI
jgi:hypothetical protein